jgi:hypothetical protein
MHFTVVDPLDGTGAVVGAMCAAGRPVRVVWTPPHRESASRARLQADLPALEQVELASASRPGLGDGPVLAGSAEGFRVAAAWNAAAADPARWMDKLAFDQALQRLAPGLALGVGEIRAGETPAAGTLLRQRYSDGSGSARLAGAGAAHGEQSTGAQCGHAWWPGRSFFCNGVRYADGFVVTDTWRCHDRRFGDRVLLCGVGAMSPHGVAHAAIVESVQSAAQALELPLGPFHVEGIVGDGGAVRLLKLLPRVAGAPLPTLCARMSATTQPALVAWSWPDSFQRAPVLEAPLRYAGDFSFPVQRSGRLVELVGIDRLEALPSFDRYLHRCQVGDDLAATDTELDRPVSVMLAHADPAQLERDLEACGRLLDAGLFHLE